jgi:hypothetical protein
METVIIALRTSVGGIAMGTGSTGLNTQSYILSFLTTLIVGLFAYVYFAFALYTMAKKLGYEKAWLAFIPYANIYLIHSLSGKGCWMLYTFIGFVAYFHIPFPIPFLDGLMILLLPLPLILLCVWLGEIARKLHSPYIIGFLTPIAASVFLISYSLFAMIQSSMNLPSHIYRGFVTPLMIIGFLSLLVAMAFIGIMAWKKSISDNIPLTASQ